MKAAGAGFGGRVSFEVATAQDFPADGYDLVTFLGCLHDLGDPEGVLRHVEQSLVEDDIVMIVELDTSASVLDNINPMGRSFASGSVALCLPAALAQRSPCAGQPCQAVGHARHLVPGRGLHTWRVSVETPTNRIYEVKR